MNASFKNGFFGVLGVATGLWVVGKIADLNKKPDTPKEEEPEKETGKTDADKWEDTLK